MPDIDIPISHAPIQMLRGPQFCGGRGARWRERDKSRPRHVRNRLEDPRRGGGEGFTGGGSCFGFVNVFSNLCERM